MLCHQPILFRSSPVLQSCLAHLSPQAGHSTRRAAWKGQRSLNQGPSVPSAMDRGGPGGNSKPRCCLATERPGFGSTIARGDSQRENPKGTSPSVESYSWVSSAPPAEPGTPVKPSWVQQSPAESSHHLPFIPNDPTSKDPALSCSPHQEKLWHSLVVFPVCISTW